MTTNDDLNDFYNFCVTYEPGVPFFPYTRKFTESVTASILLSYLIQNHFIADEKKFQEFYKTDKELCDDLDFGLHALKGAKEKLINLGIISITRKGIPATSFYTIHREILDELIIKHAPQGEDK